MNKELFDKLMRYFLLGEIICDETASDEARCNAEEQQADLVDELNTETEVIEARQSFVL